MPATYDDANVVVQLLNWSTGIGLMDATFAIFSDEFDPETASMAEPALRSVLFFGETVGTLVKQNVLDRGLVLDLWWIDGMWAKVAPAALRMRESLGEPRMYENFEALAKSAS